MAQERAAAVEREALAPRSDARVGEALPPQAGLLLSLQQSVGNRAVSGLVQRWREDTADAGLGQRLSPGAARENDGPRTSPLKGRSPTPPHGPVQLAKGDKRRERDRATALRAEWAALAQQTNPLKARVTAAANLFDYANELPAELIADWEEWHTLPVLETQLENLGQEINRIKTDAIFANQALGDRATVAVGVADRARIAALRQELQNHIPHVVRLENQVPAWIAMAQRLEPTFTAAVKARTDTAPISAAKGDGEVAKDIRDTLAVLTSQWKGLAQMILAAAPNEAEIKQKVENWTAKHYERIRLTSANMMALNQDARPVATAVLDALTKGGKVSTSPIEAVYRSEPFDKPADKFSISWKLQLTNPTPQERHALSWMTSWELHAHCKLLRAPAPAPGPAPLVPGPPIGFTMTPGAAHVKPTVKQRALGVSIDVPQAFMSSLQNASQNEFLGWLQDNQPLVTGPKFQNFAAKQ